MIAMLLFAWGEVPLFFRLPTYPVKHWKPLSPQSTKRDCVLDYELHAKDVGVVC